VIAERNKLPQRHGKRMRSESPAGPAEQLRLALLELQRAHLDFAKTYGTPHADMAAASADEARHQAARWAALLQASQQPDE
jgi:hypothetical protein